MAQSLTATPSSSRTNVTVIDLSAKSFAHLTSANGRPRRFWGKTAASIVPWKRYCNRINYSACNEDSSCEIRSLRPGPGKRLLCITAGGGRVLNLVARRPDEVWAVDINPWQNHLLELKMAGIRALDHESFLSFVGLRPSARRVATYQEIRHELSDPAREAFNARPGLIEKGVLFQGNLERFFRVTSGIIGCFWRRNRDRLFGCEDLESQQTFLAAKWNSSFWKFLGQMMCHKAFLVIFADDPGFMNYLPEDLVVHRRIFERLERYLQNNLARDNPLLSLIFYGRYCCEHCMPLYLRKDCFDKMKAALEDTKVRIVTGLIGDVLRETPGSTFDGFSLSDIASYMSKDTLDSHLGEVIRTARKGAKICLRYCLARREPSNAHAERIRRDTELETRFALHDHAMIHEFTVGEII